MAQLVCVARPHDGLVLAETREDATHVPAGVRQQLQQLLGALRSVSPRCSVEVSGGFTMHLVMQDGICLLALFGRNYPRSMAFAFLDEVALSFQEELKRAFGTGSVDYRSRIDTICTPYYFVGFERQISRLRAEYRDHRSGRALARLNSSELSAAAAPSAATLTIEGILRGCEDGCHLDAAWAPVSGQLPKAPSASSRSAWAYFPCALLATTLVALAVAAAAVGPTVQGGGGQGAWTLGALVAALACCCRACCRGAAPAPARGAPAHQLSKAESLL